LDAKGKYLVFSGSPVTFIPHSDSTFSLQYRLWGLFPINVRGMTIETHFREGRIMLVFRSQGIASLIGEKFVPETPPQEWLDRLGSYEPVNDRKGVYTDRENEVLNKLQRFLLSYDPKDKTFKLNDDPIRAISPTEAVTIGWGRSAGETIRA
jgi:hypothetical protein